MGLGIITAALGGAGGALADTWKDFIYCDALSENVLVAKGKKRVSSRSANTKGDDNVITNGSVIAVNEGQFMIIVDQGKIVEYTAEPGQFVYETSTEPSLFSGDLGDAIADTFKVIGKRISFGGDSGKDQRVYFINKKVIIGNKYGTPNPVPFRIVDKNINLDIDVSVTCFGEFSYRITNPLLFYTNVCGNVTDNYTRDRIDSTLRNEIMTALQPAFAKISALGIRYYELPGHTPEIINALNEVLSQQWVEKKGISVVDFGILSLKVPPEDEAMIKQLQRTAVMRDPGMAAATLVGAQADAMVGAANNKNAGPTMAFAAMNMASNAGGMNASNLFAMQQQQQAMQASQAAQAPVASTPTPAPAAHSANGWKCECGATNTGKFCAECGKAKPEDNFWTCSCGAKNKGKFCSECGKGKPAGAKLYKCDKCGWEPEDPKHPPRFCPECGDVFDANDQSNL